MVDAKRFPVVVERGGWRVVMDVDDAGAVVVAIAGGGLEVRVPVVDAADLAAALLAAVAGFPARVRLPGGELSAAREHGRRSTYAAGCRCDACRGAEREHGRRRAERRRAAAADPSGLRSEV